MTEPDQPTAAKLDLTNPGAALRMIFTDQRFRYVLVGGINTVFSFGLFVGFNAWFGHLVPSAVPLSLAWIISVICVFFAQRALVFKVTGHLVRDLSRFVLVNSGALAINLVVLFILSDLWGAPRVPTQLAITVVTVILSYLGHKYFSFHRSPEEPGEAGLGDDEQGR